MMNRQYLPIPLLAARGYRFKGLQQVDLFWSGSRADSFDVYRDGQRIATVSASPYTDRLGGNGSGSYRYSVCEAATARWSKEAAVTFRGAR
jgi:hypothetical protein